MCCVLQVALARVGSAGGDIALPQDSVDLLCGTRGSASCMARRRALARRLHLSVKVS